MFNFQMDNILSLHGLVGGKSCKAGFPNTSKFLFVKNFKPDGYSQIADGLKNDRSTAVGDRGILYFDNNDKDFKFYNFASNITTKVHGTDDYGEQPWVSAIPSGFITGYRKRSAVYDQYFVFSLITEEGRYIRDESINLSGYKYENHKIQRPIQDVINKNIIISFRSSKGSVFTVMYIFNSNLSKLKDYNTEDKDGVYTDERNTMAYDGILYSPKSSSGLFGRFDYMNNSGNASFAFNSSKIGHIVVNPKSNPPMGYNISQGVCFNPITCQYYSNANGIPMVRDWVALDRLKCISQNPSPKTNWLFAGTTSTLYEVDANVKKINSAFSSFNPDIRYVTEIYGKDNNPEIGALVSPSGKTMSVVYHNDNSTFWLYRR